MNFESATPLDAERRSVRVPRRGIFLDRDGTIIRDTHYLKDPNDVVLLPEAAGALRRFNYVFIPVIVVTNQSGIARGMLTEADYEAVKGRMEDLLSERGAFVDATYHCPHHPDITGPCDCRKPGLALYERARAERSVDPASSVFIGDRWRDIAAALHYGGRGILIPSPDTPAEEIARAEAEAEVAPDLKEASRRILDL